LDGWLDRLIDRSIDTYKVPQESTMNAFMEGPVVRGTAFKVIVEIDQQRDERLLAISLRWTESIEQE